MHGGRSVRGEPPHLSDLFNAGLLDGLERTKMSQEGLPPLFPDARDLLEQREKALLPPKLLVVREGETMGLVPNLLE